MPDRGYAAKAEHRAEDWTGAQAASRLETAVKDPSPSIGAGLFISNYSLKPIFNESMCADAMCRRACGSFQREHALLH